MKIYVVEGCVNYEGCSCIKAFKTKEQADEFASQCDDYNQTKPQFPDDYENDEIYNEWEAKEEQWRERHPAIQTFDDYYHVSEIELAD